MPAGLYRFGPFTLDSSAYRLVRGEVSIALSPKLIDLLAYLVSRPGSLATKEELLNAIWPDVSVTDNSLTRAISELRDALGDKASSPRYIQTVARRGYRFIGEVVTEAAPALAGAVPPGPAVAATSRTRETPSLDAYRALTDGRLRLESLEAHAVPDAIAQFERAVEIDPHYAVAHVGLANARFWQYELSRDTNQPDTGLLARAIADVRHAIELDPLLAEAHATLSYLLVSAGRTAEAQEAAHRAVALEPQYWGHYFRLAHASWGEARLAALTTAVGMYPEFPFAHFEMAMVWIARNRMDQAEAILREGIVVLDRQIGRRERFPASGLHWMLGLVRLAHDDADDAAKEFATEIASNRRQLYAREFTTAAHHAMGGLALAKADAKGAEAAFREALALDGNHARSHLGLSLALAAMGRAADADRERQRARDLTNQLSRGPRVQEATLLRAMDLSADGKAADALSGLTLLVEKAPPGWTGWTIPLEPLLQPIRSLPGYADLLAKLAGRAA